MNEILSFRTSGSRWEWSFPCPIFGTKQAGCLLTDISSLVQIGHTVLSYAYDWKSFLTSTVMYDIGSGDLWILDEVVNK